MSHTERYQRILSATDIMDVEIETDQGRVIGFSLNLRARIGEEWREVKRYDTRHGRLHVHRFWLPEEARIQWLEEEGDEATTDYARELREAEEELKRNWEIHRKRLRG
ncbi:MAG TPA: hypothetical protein VI893_02150 [Thermoplasmata archaeon]|nr:hypothetical protein [Thermoplasmata archaeon]